MVPVQQASERGRRSVQKSLTVEWLGLRIFRPRRRSWRRVLAGPSRIIKVRRLLVRPCTCRTLRGLRAISCAFSLGLIRGVVSRFPSGLDQATWRCGSTQFRHCRSPTVEHRAKWLLQRWGCLTRVSANFAASLLRWALGDRPVTSSLRSRGSLHVRHQSALCCEAHIMSIRLPRA